MSSLSFRRKLSSTAFLTHWLHRPLAHALALGHAQAAGVQVGDDVLHGLAHFGRRWSALSAARPSQARSMIDSLELLGHGVRSVQALDEVDDALRGFQAFGGVGHQRHADAAARRG